MSIKEGGARKLREWARGVKACEVWEGYGESIR